MSRVLLCPGPHQVLPNPPALPLRSGGFLVCARSLSESGRVAAALMPHVRHRSEAVDVDHGQVVGRGLKDVAVVVGLHEFVPVGRRAPRGCDWRRFERFAQMCERLTLRGRSHPGVLPLANLRFEVSRLLPAVFSEPDVAAAGWALERKLLAHPGDQFRPGNPGGVVRAGLSRRVVRVAASFRAVTVAPMPAGRGVAPLADVPDRERRDGPAPRSSSR